MKVILILFILWVLAIEWRYRKERVIMRRATKRFVAK